MNTAIAPGGSLPPARETSAASAALPQGGIEARQALARALRPGRRTPAGLEDPHLVLVRAEVEIPRILAVIGSGQRAVLLRQCRHLRAPTRPQ